MFSVRHSHKDTYPEDVDQTEEYSELAQSGTEGEEPTMSDKKENMLKTLPIRQLRQSPVSEDNKMLYLHF